MSNILVVLMCITVLIHAGILLHATIKKDRFIEKYDELIEESKECSKEFWAIVDSYNEARQSELMSNPSGFVKDHQIRQDEMQERFDKRMSGVKKGN